MAADVRHSFLDLCSLMRPREKRELQLKNGLHCRCKHQVEISRRGLKVQLRRETSGEMFALPGKCSSDEVEQEQGLS